MHGSVVPTEKQMTAPERAIGPLPPCRDVTDNGGKIFVQLGEAASQQDGQVDSFCVVVQLTLVCRKPGPARERFRQPLLVEKVPDVVIHSALKRLGATGISGKSLNFRQRLHDETGMEVIDEIPLSVDRVIP